MTQEGLQYELFTGALVDNRARAQKQQEKQRVLPQQAEMFSQRELAQYVNPHPTMDVSPGPLVLIAEDPRTPEEKERDLQRAAERETVPLFVDAPTGSDAEAQPEPQVVEENPKVSAYLKLVEVCTEQAALIDPRPVTQLEYTLLIALTTWEAKETGLDKAEITAAVQVGEHRGKQEQNMHALRQEPKPPKISSPRTIPEPELSWLSHGLLHTLAPSRF